VHSADIANAMEYKLFLILSGLAGVGIEDAEWDGQVLRCWSRNRLEAGHIF
jgi:hypothetical protein